MGTANSSIFEGLPDNELLCFGLASDIVSEQLGRIGISDNSSMRNVSAKIGCRCLHLHLHLRLPMTHGII